jgi:hypothetical protein
MDLTSWAGQGVRGELSMLHSSCNCSTALPHSSCWHAHTHTHHTPVVSAVRRCSTAATPVLSTAAQQLFGMHTYTPHTSCFCCTTMPHSSYTCSKHCRTAVVFHCCTKCCSAAPPVLHHCRSVVTTSLQTAVTE